MSKKVDSKSFEENMSRLEEIAVMLDNGSVSLEEALKLYEEGISLAKACAIKLTHVEKNLYELSKSADGLFSLTEIEDDE